MLARPVMPMACLADGLSWPLIGRLKARLQPNSISEIGASCEEQSSYDGLDPHLEDLPIAEDIVPPRIEMQRDICPQKYFDEREAPICSSGDPADKEFVVGVGVCLQKALAYMSYGCLEHGRL